MQRGRNGVWSNSSMATVLAVNIKRKTEMKMSSHNKLFGIKGKLVSCMCSLDCVVCVLALVFYFLKWEELNWMQCTVKVNYDDMTSCGNKMPTRCNRWIFIADLTACSTCFGHHCAHHQGLESIIQVVAVPVVFGAWFSSCRYGVELRVVCPVCGLLHCDHRHRILACCLLRLIVFYYVLYMNWVYLINILRFVALESCITKAGLYECYQDIYAVNAVCVLDGIFVLLKCNNLLNVKF
jgi:hypothetical protein